MTEIPLSDALSLSVAFFVLKVNSFFSSEGGGAGSSVVRGSSVSKTVVISSEVAISDVDSAEDAGSSLVAGTADVP